MDLCNACIYVGAFICHHSNKKGPLSGKTTRPRLGLLLKKNLMELLELYIHAKEVEAPVKTDQGLIHTHEIVPVVQFQRERTAEQRKTKKKCSSDVGES